MSEQFTLYLETTIPSFLTARPSNNLVVAGKQETTRQWWERRRSCYRLFISQYVLDEISGGDLMNSLAETTNEPRPSC